MRRKTRGYSLYELLVTAMLTSLLAVIAVPNYEKIVANGRIRTETDALFHAVHLARKESIVRRRAVAICPSSNGSSCSAGVDWSGGWLMFENNDLDEPPRIDPGEAVLRSHVSDPDIRITGNRRGFTLRAIHRRATNGTLVVCDRRNRAAPRAVVVSYTGRPRIALKRPNGEPYGCID